jgi:hypothetical protein
MKRTRARLESGWLPESPVVAGATEDEGDPPEAAATEREQPRVFEPCDGEILQRFDF